MKIGIVGNGFVGNAVKQGLKTTYPNILVNDINPEFNEADLRDVVEQCKIIFICVNTPMTKEGECHTGIIESVLDDIVMLQPEDMSTIVVIKSTVPPGTTYKFQKSYSSLDFVFNPEFLTEANAVNDFICQDRIILGSTKLRAMDYVYLMYFAAFPNIPIVTMTPCEAEMVKYVSNTFLSTKVIFANEINTICKGLRINYDKVIHAAKMDPRLGYSHWKVPGPDGDYGFGGHCFPKDLSAIIFKAEESKIQVPLLKVVKDINDQIRTDRNWEKQKGRAVI